MSTGSSSALRPSRADRARLLAAGGLVALLGGMAAIVLTSGGTSTTVVPAPATTEPAATAPAPKPVRPSTVAIPVSGVGAYDPEGDQSENGGSAGLATDGNPGTAWKSERYRSTFTKSGVGLVLDAGKDVTASRVAVTTETPGFEVEIQVGDSPTGPFTAVSAPKDLARTTTFVLKPKRARYLMLWIMSMPAERAAAVNEVTVRGPG